MATPLSSQLSSVLSRALGWPETCLLLSLCLSFSISRMGVPDPQNQPESQKPRIGLFFVMFKKLEEGHVKHSWKSGDRL